MKRHFLCMGLSYWLITKNKKDVIEEDKLEGCDKTQKYVFIFKMLAREALLLALTETKFGQVESLRFDYDIWNNLKITFEGD